MYSHFESRNYLLKLKAHTHTARALLQVDLHQNGDLKPSKSSANTSRRPDPEQSRTGENATVRQTAGERINTRWCVCTKNYTTAIK